MNLSTFRFLILSLIVTVAAPVAARDVEFRPAELPFDVPDPSAVEFGYLQVPENRSDPESRWIEVAVAILKSRSADPARDPLIHIIGGPGASHLTSAKYTGAIPYLDERDVVLFEQRGTRFSKPHLTCPELEGAARTSELQEDDADEARERRVDATRACAERLRNAGVDLDGYRTTEVAADVEDFRRLMGYDQINLLAVSYGTKVAQVLMREHPSTLRSVILDSVLPLEVDWEEEWLGHRRAALDRLFEACAEDPRCAEAYPALASRFWSKIQELDARPVGLPDGVSQLRADRILGQLSADVTSGIPYLPMLADAVAREDLEILAPYLDASTDSGSRVDFAMAMRMACWCAEEVPFLDQARIDRAVEGAGMPGQSPYVVDPALCEALSVSPASPLENEPVRADMPVLFVSGGLDSATPSVWAENLASRFPRARRIEFPLWGHAPSTYWDEPCAQALIADFLSDPSQELSDPCLESATRVDFVTP